MTLATVSETTRPKRMRLRRAGRVALSLDAFLMAASLAVCALLFTQGGLEAFIGALAGAIIGVRNAERGERLRAAFAGGFAGLFAGALLAAFFHGAIAAFAPQL
jgi:hypothetical protein